MPALLVFGARNLGRTIAQAYAADGWGIAAVARTEETVAALGIDGALGIGKPVFHDLAEGLHGVVDLVGIADLLGAVLARLEIGGHGAAAFFHQPGEIPGQRIEVDCRAPGGLIASTAWR